MKLLSLTLIALAQCGVLSSLAYGPPELERLKANYEQDLRDLYKRYSEEGMIDDAAKVIAELRVIDVEAPERIPQDRARRFIANTAWKTPTGTIFEFQANGQGKRSFNGKDDTNVLWSVRAGGLVEVRGPAGQGQAVTTWFFRFESKTEGYYGPRENEVTRPLQKMR